MTLPTHNIRSVAITGALGNLGSKLLAHLHRQDPTLKLIGLDNRPISSVPAVRVAGVDYVECDLGDWQDQRWRKAIEQANAVVHFAARNPYPGASWEEVATSIDMTLHIANAARESAATQRVVFATSNHVMGRYKDEPLASQVGAGELTPDLAPGVGTVWFNGSDWSDSTSYATTKLVGERICQASAAYSNGKTTFAAIRIGWCQPGENLPTTLSAAGVPGASQAAPDDPALVEEMARADWWFKTMWLSNRDFLQIFSNAIFVDGSGWHNGSILVNGMSNNKGMKWSLEESRRWLGYEPVDDVMMALQSAQS